MQHTDTIKSLMLKFRVQRDVWVALGVACINKIKKEFNARGRCTYLTIHVNSCIKFQTFCTQIDTSFNFKIDITSLVKTIFFWLLFAFSLKKTLSIIKNAKLDLLDCILIQLILVLEIFFYYGHPKWVGTHTSAPYR